VQAMQGISCRPLLQRITLKSGTPPGGKKIKSQSEAAYGPT